MSYSYSTYGLLIIVIILIYILFRKPRDLRPLKGTDITGDSQSGLRKWDCSPADRQILLSDVPAGLTPYLYAFDEARLREQPLEGFKKLISVSADIRLLDKDSKEVEKLESPIRVWMGYNARDILALQASGYTVDDLVPVKIVPGSTGWRRFPEETVNYENLKCGELGGVYITVNSWGDPPIGWGVPK